MATTSTVTYWNNAVVYGPIIEAHQVALQEAAKAAEALAPGRIKVHAVPTGTTSGELAASGPGAVFQEEGARPHTIAPRKAKALAGKGFGPVSGKVDHPGNPALHYTARGAQTYPGAFTAAARARFAL